MVGNLIGNRPENGGNVFPSPAVEGKPLTVRSLSRVLRRAGHFDLEPFTPHDLRRTVATQLAKLETPHFIVGKVLGHSEQGITAVYDRHDYDAEKRQALEKWSRRLSAIISGQEEDKVVPIR